MITSSPIIVAPSVREASDTQAGFITTSAQTFAGRKTFNDGLDNAQGALTNGAITRNASAQVRSVYHKFSWTNANVAGLTGTTGNLVVGTLPAKTLVKSALIIITGQAAGVTALTVSLGRTASAYIDYLVASDAKAVANTVYGDTFTDLGANLSELIGDLPSVTGTTAVNLQFVSAIEDLSTVTGSTGEIILETVLLP